MLKIMWRCFSTVALGYLWSMAGLEMVLFLHKELVKDVPSLLMGLAIPLTFVIVQAIFTAVRDVENAHGWQKSYHK